MGQTLRMRAEALAAGRVEGAGVRRRVLQALGAAPKSHTAGREAAEREGGAR